MRLQIIESFHKISESVYIIVFCVFSYLCGYNHNDDLQWVNFSMSFWDICKDGDLVLTNSIGWIATHSTYEWVYKQRCVNISFVSDFEWKIRKFKKNRTHKAYQQYEIDLHLNTDLTDLWTICIFFFFFLSLGIYNLRYNLRIKSFYFIRLRLLY